MHDSRPLDFLAAFAICFIAGMASAVALGGYSTWVRRKSTPSVNSAQDQAVHNAPVR